MTSRCEQIDPTGLSESERSSIEGNHLSAPGYKGPKLNFRSSAQALTNSTGAEAMKQVEVWMKQSKEHGESEAKC